jgi:hypothetical protein
MKMDEEGSGIARVKPKDCSSKNSEKNSVFANLMPNTARFQM